MEKTWAEPDWRSGRHGDGCPNTCGSLAVANENFGHAESGPYALQDIKGEVIGFSPLCDLHSASQIVTPHIRTLLGFISDGESQPTGDYYRFVWG